MVKLPGRLARILLWGALATAVGTAASLVSSASFNGVLTTLGMFALGLAIHLLGRAGPA